MKKKDSTDTVFYPRQITAAGAIMDDPTYTIVHKPLNRGELPKEDHEDFCRLTTLT